jgi:hypothetical protein
VEDSGFAACFRLADHTGTTPLQPLELPSELRLCLDDTQDRLGHLPHIWLLLIDYLPQQILDDLQLDLCFGDAGFEVRAHGPRLSHEVCQRKPRRAA